MQSYVVVNIINNLLLSFNFSSAIRFALAIASYIFSNDLLRTRTHAHNARARACAY